MKFKEFSRWCNDRAADGCWSMITAMCCIDILNDIRKEPFWRREKIWKSKYEKDVVNDIVKPIEQKIKDYKENRYKKKG